MDGLHYWLIFPVVLLASAILGLFLIPLSRAVGLVDHPGERKVHESATPLAGGPAIFVILGTLLALRAPTSKFDAALFAGISLVFMVGLVDDRRHVSPIIRFLVQVAACLVMVWGGGILAH